MRHKYVFYIIGGRMLTEITGKKPVEPIIFRETKDIPNEVVLIVFGKMIAELEYASEICDLYSNLQLVNRSFYKLFSNNLLGLMKYGNVTLIKMVHVVNMLHTKSGNNVSRKSLNENKTNIENEVIGQVQKLLSENKIAEVINVIQYMDPEGNVLQREREKIIAKVIKQPYYWGNSSDHMITELALICAEKDPRATAQWFHKIPILFLKNGVKVGISCAKKNPSATLEFKDSFEKRLVVESFGQRVTKHLGQVMNQAKEQLAITHT
jgi:hypothetical protein